MATAMVLGTQWGDEGKGKIVDYLAQKAYGSYRRASYFPKKHVSSVTVLL